MFAVDGSPTAFKVSRRTYNEWQSNPLPPMKERAETNGTHAPGGESCDGLCEVGSVWKRLKQNGQHVSVMIVRHVWIKNDVWQAGKWGHEKEEKKNAMPSEVGTRREWSGQWIFIVLPSRRRMSARSDLHTSVTPSLSCIAENHSTQRNFSVPRCGLFPAIGVHKYFKERYGTMRFGWKRWTRRTEEGRPVSA